MSTHQVDVFALGDITKHPNADTLGIVQVLGFTCCVKLGQFQSGKLVAYIEPDMVVDTTRPEFNFLQGVSGNGVKGNKNLRRIAVRRLRGVMSQGLIIAAPPSLEEGDNAMEALGITRYEPPLHMSTFGEAEGAPSGRYAPSYNVENWRRNRELLQSGELVLVTEKLHGCSARYCFHDGRMYCGSRVQWKRQRDDILWWQALKQNPWLELFCREHPEVTVYGEVFGQVADLTYGAKQRKHDAGDVFVKVFDLLVKDQWLSWADIKARYPAIMPFWVPVVYEGSYDPEKTEQMAEGKTLIPGANHIREGVVVQPINERTDPDIGRIKLKIVGNGYLSRKTR